MSLVHLGKDEILKLNISKQTPLDEARPPAPFI